MAKFNVDIILRKNSTTHNQDIHPLSIILHSFPGKMVTSIWPIFSPDRPMINAMQIFPELRLCCGNIFPCLQNTNCQPGAHSPDLLSSDVRNINQINLFLYISGYLYPFMFYQSPFHTIIYFTLCGLRIQFL